MNHSRLLQALMAVPEPNREAPLAIVIGPDFNVPIHDKAHCRRAIMSWLLYSFPSPQARKQAALQIAERAVTLSLVTEGLQIVRGK
jgi:hypothetical protein